MVPILGPCLYKKGFKTYALDREIAKKKDETSIAAVTRKILIKEERVKKGIIKGSIIHLGNKIEEN